MKGKGVKRKREEKGKGKRKKSRGKNRKEGPMGMLNPGPVLIELLERVSGEW